MLNALFTALESRQFQAAKFMKIAQLEISVVRCAIKSDLEKSRRPFGRKFLLFGINYISVGALVPSGKNPLRRINPSFLQLLQHCLSLLIPGNKPTHTFRPSRNPLHKFQFI